MAPRRKRQRLSEDGAEAVTATAAAEVEQPAKARDAVPSKKENARRQLFVRGLAKSVTTQDLTDYFSESYPIKHALVVLDKETKESKGYGFVTFADVDDAQRAAEELNNTKLQGKKISVESAEARQREGEPDRVKVGDRIKAEREQAKKDNQTPKLIIRNLPWSINSVESLQKHFRSYGKVNFINLPKKPNGELRGFAFVSLRGRKNAEKAILELNGKEIDGRQIAVDWAVDRDAWQTLQKGEQEGGDGDVDMEDAESSVVSSDDESAEEEGSEDEEDDDDDDDDDESNTDYGDEDGDEDVSDSDPEGGIELDEEPKAKRPDYTIFVRNLPFHIDDEALKQHFQQFGGIRFARVVLDRDTERPKGTGFVAFFSEEDMINCLRGVPRTKLHTKATERKDGTTITVTHSVLEDGEQDPTGRYTIDGRVLQLSRAVDKNEATRLTTENAATRFNRDKDKRRLYLLGEGTISSNSPLYEQLSPSELKMRQESATLRRKQIQENPSLHLSLTRLSIRNIPRSITSKDLKALARQAVVGFAADVKAGKRSKLNREETIRGGETMLVAEKQRKKRGKGIVKQAKVVFETPAGSKVGEESGAGRSRGYGFIEYYTHRTALMGLRWLNGHAVDYKAKGAEAAGKTKKAAKEALEDKRKRLIVEFAIENANVVSRRSDREEKDRQPGKPKAEAGDDDEPETNSKANAKADGKGGKRKRGVTDTVAGVATQGAKGKAGKTQGSGAGVGGSAEAEADKGKLAQRTRIIAKKRQARKAKRAGK